MTLLLYRRDIVNQCDFDAEVALLLYAYLYTAFPIPFQDLIYTTTPELTSVLDTFLIIHDLPRATKVIIDCDEKYHYLTYQSTAKLIADSLEELFGF